MDADCKFCRIIAGDRDAHIVYQDELTAAFLDANPAIEGHTLVVPAVHRTCLSEMNDEERNAVFRTVQRVIDAMDEALEPDGYSMFHTTGSLVGNVEHAHIHILPRDEDDDLELGLLREELTDEGGERVASRLRSSL